MKSIPGNRESFERIFCYEQRREAVSVALDIRKFELELYWRRATYYWTFIAAAFGAYFLIYRFAKEQLTLLFTVSCIGFTFSLAWYLANRGGKFWSNNWELLVDYLEDAKIGPLYKTVADPRHFRFRNLLTAYPYSVAKINQVLNLYVTGIWLFSAIHSISRKYKWAEPFPDSNMLWVGLFTVVMVIWMLCGAKTDFKKRTSMSFIQRELPTQEKADNGSDERT